MANWTNSTLYNRLLEFLGNEGLDDGQTIGELITALEAAIVFDATNRTKVKKASGREAFETGGGVVLGGTPTGRATVTDDAATD
jgi:hypothetical protein